MSGYSFMGSDGRGRRNISPRADKKLSSINMFSPDDDFDSSNDFAVSPESANSDVNYGALRDLSSGINVEEDEDSDGQDIFATVVAPKRRAVTRMRGSASKPKASASVRKVDAINTRNLGYTNDITRVSLNDAGDYSNLTSSGASLSVTI